MLGILHSQDNPQQRPLRPKRSGAAAERGTQGAMQLQLGWNGYKQNHRCPVCTHTANTHRPSVWPSGPRLHQHRDPVTGREDARRYRLSWEAVRGDSVLLLKIRRIPNPHDRLWRVPSRLLPWATTSTTATMLGWLKDVWKYTGCKQKSEAG